MGQTDVFGAAEGAGQVIRLVCFGALRWLLIGFFALSCISCHTEARNMNSLRIDKLFEKTKAVCFGRFVVDVPVGVTVVGGPQTFNGAIETMPSSSGSASRVIEAKARELRATKHAILSPGNPPAKPAQ